MLGHFHNRRGHVVSARVLACQLPLATKYPPAFAKGLLQRITHVFKAAFVDQRPHQIAFQRMTDTHFGIGRLEPGDNFFLDRVVGNQPAQAGAALPGSTDSTEQDGTHGHVQVGTRRQNHRIVAAQLQNTAGKACGDFRCHFAAHARAAGGTDQRDSRIVNQGFARFTTTNHHLGQVLGRALKRAQHTIKQGLTGQRRQRGFFRWFPDHRVAAYQRQRGIPRPHGHRKVECADHTHHTQRVPGFTHMVAWSLRGDGQAVELTRQANCKVADVDHFLHFAQPFLGDLARFP